MRYVFGTKSQNQVGIGCDSGCQVCRAPVDHSQTYWRAKDQTEEAVLRQRALDWIDEQTAQLSLFPAQKQKLLVVYRGECIGVTHHFAFRFFMGCFDECGLSHLPRLLLDLAIMRLIEAASKLRSVELLGYYFGIGYSGDTDPPCPVMLTPHKDYGSENLND